MERGRQPEKGVGAQPSGLIGGGRTPLSLEGGTARE
jgi:hypothetical protein